MTQEKPVIQVEGAYPGLEVRYTEPEDIDSLREWFADVETRKGFPMDEANEIEDSCQRWIGFHKYKCSLTATIEGKPVGVATLWLQPYKKIAHQCEFGMVVSKEMRGKGVGSLLLNSLMHLAKERFKIELIHLTVYSDNPAIRLYERFGFKRFGEQSHWCKEDNGEYLGRIFMERFL